MPVAVAFSEVGIRLTRRGSVNGVERSEELRVEGQRVSLDEFKWIVWLGVDVDANNAESGHAVPHAGAASATEEIKESWLLHASCYRPVLALSGNGGSTFRAVCRGGLCHRSIADRVDHREISFRFPRGFCGYCSARRGLYDQNSKNRNGRRLLTDTFGSSLRVPPDFLDAEFNAAAEVQGLVFFGRANAR